MVILTTFHHPESPILHEQRDTKVILDQRDLGSGTIYISEGTLCWKGQEGTGFCIEYPHVSMHAISTDPSIYQSECIYIMIDGVIRLPGHEPVDAHITDEGYEETDSQSDDEGGVSQLVLIPADASSIRTIYHALSECQVLNPDPDDLIDEEDENVYEDAEDNNDDFPGNGAINNFRAGGDAEINHLSSRLLNHSLHNNHANGDGDQNFEEDQFEDAD